METNERIAQILLTEGITAKLFAEKLGVERSSISHLLSGRNKPSLDFLDKFFEQFPDYNPIWLISGKGEMKITKQEERKDIIKKESNTVSLNQKNEQKSLFDFQTEGIIKDLNESEKQNITFVTKQENNYPKTSNIQTNTFQNEEITAHEETGTANKEIEYASKSSINKLDEIRRIVIFFDNGQFETYSERKT